MTEIYYSILIEQFIETKIVDRT